MEKGRKERSGCRCLQVLVVISGINTKPLFGVIAVSDPGMSAKGC